MGRCGASKSSSATNWISVAAGLSVAASGTLRNEPQWRRLLSRATCQQAEVLSVDDCIDRVPSFPSGAGRGEACLGQWQPVATGGTDPAVAEVGTADLLSTLVVTAKVFDERIEPS